jgi:tetratricopeptide (TPR) repeat protein
MTEPTAPPPTLPTHPTNRTVRRAFVLGGVYVAIGVAVIAVYPGALAAGAVSTLFGGVVIAGAMRLRLVGPAVILNNLAHDLLMQGRYDEAMALLDSIPPARQQGLVGMAVLSQRAYALFTQGDAAGAVRVAAEALAIKPPRLAGAQGRQYQLVLRANRSLMLAATGDADGARAEAARVDASPEAMPLLRGTAALARAVNHARAGAREALVDELARSRAVLAVLSGREAMLARTLARLAAVPPGSAYRAPASRDGALSPAARWVVAVVPQASAFAPRAAATAAPVDAAALPTPTPAALGRVVASRALAVKRAPNSVRWKLLLWLVLTSAFVFAGSFLRAAIPVGAAPWMLVALLVAIVGFLVRRNRGLDRATRDARALYAEGRVAESDAKLDRVSRASSHAHAAIALMDLAEHAERRDDLSGALARVDRALGRLFLNPAVKASSSDILVPALITLRARVLAAMGSTDDALAELAVVAREHPSFPYATGAALGVRVVVALHLGDRDLACALARSRTTDTRLPRHVETLCDLLAGEAGWYEADGERERIQRELAADPGLRAWIDRVAPGLAAPLVATTGVRIADLGGTPDAEAAEAETTAARAAAREA